MAITTQILSASGILFSLYALYVKYRASRSKHYKPLCDINEHISCTRAFTSRYGSIAILPNPLYGLLFYAAMIALDFLGYLNAIVYLALFSAIGSVYLAYLSYYKQKNFCLVCTAIYLTNIALLISSIFQ